MKSYNIILTICLLVSCNDSKPAPEVAISAKESIVKSIPPPPPIKKDTALTMDFLMGKFDPKKEDDFVVIEAKYANRNGMYLQQATYESFKKMHAAAQQDGVELVIKSATRNFFSQKSIWEAACIFLNDS
ncbi:MAG: D-alanyl-D-alanine carboxypeptidase family protein [Bacteroidota bacterium]